MNVSAVDKSTGKSEKIVITNDKGRLSKEEIEKLVKDAEKFRNEDEKVKGQVEARNALENYTYSIKHTLQEEKLKDKFTADETAKISAAVE